MRSAPIKLLVIELNYHAEVLRNLCLLLDQGNFSVALFTTEKIWKKADLPKSVCDRMEVYIKEKKQSVPKFLEKHKSVIDSSEIVYFNTLEKFAKYFYRLKLKQPTIIRSHNLHSDLSPWKKIDYRNNNVLSIGFYLLTRVLFEGLWRNKKKMFGAATSIMFANSGLTQYAKEQGLVNSSEKIADPCMPFSYLDPIPDCGSLVDSAVSPPDDYTVPVDAHRAERDETLSSHEDSFSFVVTGSINPKRKNYDELYRALVSAIPQFEKKVKLVFLGGPKGAAGRQVIDKFKTLRSAAFEFEYSDGFVPVEEFEAGMDRARFMVAPIEVYSQRKIIYEIYGRSKISGVDCDMIVNTKPTLVTASYHISDELKAVCEEFQGDLDLSDKLVDWINNDRYRDYQSGFDKLDTYVPATILEKFETFCDQLIEESVYRG